MTTKNCANGPKLVLKNFVRNDRLRFLYLLGYRGRGGEGRGVGVEGRGGEWEWRGGEGSGSGGLGKSKDSSKHFALITKFVSYFDSQLLIIY